MGNHSAERQPEAGQSREKRRWHVHFDQKGDIIGLPESVSRKDVIVFLDADGGWQAANPPPEILEEIKMWRSDWM